MDELKLRLNSKLMRGIVTKLISKAIFKKYGYKVDIQLDELDVSVINGETKIKTSVEVKCNSDEFTKIMKSIGMEES